MITLKDYMETVNYRITEGSEYYCNAFGDNLYCLSAWNGDHDGWSTNIVFDTETQTSYMVEVCDYKNNRAYRMINSDYKDEFMNNDDSSHRDQAWDDIDFIDLETDEDWLEKARAIVNERDYDTRVSVPLELSDSDLMMLFKQAHDADMSLNEYVEELLRDAIKRYQQYNDL